MYMYVHMFVYIYIDVYVYACMHACVCIYIYACMYVPTYIHAYVNVDVCVLHGLCSDQATNPKPETQEEAMHSWLHPILRKLFHERSRWAR